MARTPVHREAAADERRLYLLVLVALILSVGHHVDHAMRGNHVGWPLTPEVNAFTYSLAIYPVILTTLALYRARIIGPGAWAFVSGGGAVFLAMVHFGPWAIEPPGDIIGHYGQPILGWLAFAWLLALLVVLVGATIFEVRLWRRNRAAIPR